MEISYLGAGAVLLAGRGLTVACGPKPDAKANIVALTQPAEVTASQDAMVINGPGEYEVGGTLITGVDTAAGGEKEPATSYVFAIDDLTVGYLNGAESLNDQQLEALGNIDVLIQPIGGPNGLKSTAAAALVSQVEPRYIVAVAGEGAPSTWSGEFTKEVGATPEKSTKLKISSKDLPEEPVVVVLEKA